MEEVVGSIPTRSTIFINPLQQSCATGLENLPAFSYLCSPHQPRLEFFQSGPFSGVLGMRVDVHRQPGVGVAQESLRGLGVHVLFNDQHGGQRVPEGM